MTQQVPKRADQLGVGDRIPDEYLPMRFNKGPGEVVYVANELGYELGGGDAHTFIAYRYPNGRHDSTTVRSEARLMVYPADSYRLEYYQLLGLFVGRGGIAAGARDLADRGQYAEAIEWLRKASEHLPESVPPGFDYSRADDGETTQPIAGRGSPQYGAVVSEGGHTAVAIGGGLIESDPPEGFVPAYAPGLIVGDTATEQRDNAYAAYERDEAECPSTWHVNQGDQRSRCPICNQAA